jgi:hypothetical protein
VTGISYRRHAGKEAAQDSVAWDGAGRRVDAVPQSVASIREHHRVPGVRARLLIERGARERTIATLPIR